MKDLFNDIWAWLDYIKNREKNEKKEEINEDTIRELRNTVQKLKNERKAELKQREYISKEKDNLIALRNKRVDVLSGQLADSNKRNDELRSILEKTSKELDTTKEELAKEKKSRKKCAGAVGGLTARVNALTKELDNTNNCLKQACEELSKAKYTINFYKKHQKSPSIEELKAYDYSRKEVEKRMKNENEHEK